MPESKRKSELHSVDFILLILSGIFNGKIFQDRSCYWDVSNGYNGQRELVNRDLIKPENFQCKTPNHRLKCSEKPATCSQGKISCDYIFGP